MINYSITMRSVNTIMEFKKMTAEEAASLIQNGQTIGLSGFLYDFC